MKKEHPIIFSTPMVEAILSGRKTQTRRLVKWPLTSQSDGCNKRRLFVENDAQKVIDLLKTESRHLKARIRMPYGYVGDRLWVREAWSLPKDWDDARPGIISKDTKPYLKYLAKPQAIQTVVLYPNREGKWRSPIYMPRWASRITLEITDIRIQRLWDISENDAKAEGINPIELCCGSPVQDNNGEPICCDRPYLDWREAFLDLWKKIHRPQSWMENSWVWALSFKRAE